MKTNQYSPTPWAVGSNNGARPHIMDADGKAVAMITPRREAWNGDLLAAAPDLLFACKCALADLEGIMPEFELSGDREHPAWETIKLLKKVIK